jgi:hypothetical protein
VRITCVSHRAEIYIPTKQYGAAVNAIAALTGVDTDEVKIALGEGSQHIARVDLRGDD